eukprot:1835837-Rhodomonas_salina.1
MCQLLPRSLSQSLLDHALCRAAGRSRRRRASVEVLESRDSAAAKASEGCRPDLLPCALRRCATRASSRASQDSMLQRSPSAFCTGLAWLTLSILS